MSDSTTAIAIRAASKRYGEIRALDGIDLEVGAGQVVALLGPNGAGKTTLIRSIVGLQKLDAGEIRVLGHAAGSMESRLEMGVMLQDVDPPEALTSSELLALFSSFYADPYPASFVVEIAGLDDIEKRRYGRLSGGQKRRVQLALALCGSPKLIILDEPTTYMDTASKRQFWKVVEEMREQGKTVLLVTHQMTEVEALASRVVVLHEGGVVADGEVSSFRSAFSLSKVVCVTSLAPSAVADLPAAKRTAGVGRKLEILTERSDELVRELLASDPQVRELEVTQPSLETIIDRLLSDKNEKREPRQ